MNVDSKISNSQLCLWSNEELGILFRCVITTSPKPTNTAIALMYTSKQWCEVSKNLFERDPEVLASFVRQVERVAAGWLDIAFVSCQKNTFFLIWMVAYLKKKELEVRLGDETIKKLEIISKKTGLLQYSEVNEGCRKIIELAFAQPCSSQEITFEEISPLFDQSFYLPPSIDERIFTPQSEDLRYSGSLAYEILLHITKNIVISECLILIEKIASEIKEKFNAKFVWLNGLAEQRSWGDEYCAIKNFCLFPKYYFDENAYKLSRLIERVGNYIIKEKSSKELKEVYFKLLGQFLRELLDFALESRIKSQLGEYVKENYFEKWKPFLCDHNFEGLAIRFIQLLSSEFELDVIPECTFDVIFELKHQFPESYELVSDKIESFKKTHHCTHLENLFKIERQDVQSYFLKELENSPDLSFQYSIGERVYGRDIPNMNVCRRLVKY